MRTPNSKILRSCFSGSDRCRLIRDRQLMVRFFPVFMTLLLVFLFSGCGTERSAVSADTALNDSDTDDTAASAEDSALSDLFVSSGESENLLLYTGDALGSLSYPEMILSDENLLFYESAYSESAEGHLNLLLFSPQTGETQAAEQILCEFLTDIRRTDAGIMLCDSAMGYVLLLDENLQQIQEWPKDPTYEYWYAASDGESIYQISDGSLIRTLLTDSSDGSASVILSSSVSLYGYAAANNGADICYVDDLSQLTIDLLLDLESGELFSPDIDIPVSGLSCYDGSWLAVLEDGSSDTYVLCSGDETYAASLEDGSLMQVQGSDLLLAAVSDEETGSTTFRLYSASGAFLSSCSVTDDTLWYSGNYCIYSDRCEGCFLLLYTDDGPMLYFWEIDASSDGEDLSLTTLSEYLAAPGGTAVDASLYERARAISDTYGIEIRIADQCETTYADFTAAQETDEALIAEGLIILENAFSAYPEGFFDQLSYDRITGIQINLCGTLTPTNDNWGDETYNGLTEENGYLYLMVLDLNALYEDTVYHEFSHIIDQKLSWDAYCRPDALFSEDTWAELNPDGFEYIYTYNGFTDLSFEGDESMYFIDIYAMISPTEDRARILEYAMAGYDSYFTESDPIYEKLLYYSACIRDAFDTDGWPETTAWESVD